ncbi:hypothetical protein BHM03_00002524 [Ensete ventricosum]|uniref:Uncharacterized protein n=1 Tax=Ensete ventricosum TaxID=4639 RepID=A0A445M9Q4_ENSVE|nr:hypothetical protein BHM03_00002524 [Ensete ventricosum]
MDETRKRSGRGVDLPIPREMFCTAAAVSFRDLGNGCASRACPSSKSSAGEDGGDGEEVMFDKFPLGDDNQDVHRTPPQLVCPVSSCCELKLLSLRR